MGQKCNIQDDIEAGNTQNDHLKNMTHNCGGIFQIQPLVVEIWVKRCNFQDNVRVWVLKMIISKNDSYM